MWEGKRLTTLNHLRDFTRFVHLFVSLSFVCPWMVNLGPRRGMRCETGYNQFGSGGGNDEIKEAS
jgi:hypothetical protein